MASIRCSKTLSCAPILQRISGRPARQPKAHILLAPRRYHHIIATPIPSLASPMTTTPYPSRRSHFSTSSPRPATSCVRNPQTDDEGKPMHLELTPRAAKRLSQIMAKESNPDLALRIQVESGGCHGFQYFMRLETLPPGADGAHGDSSVLSDEDVVFHFTPDEHVSMGGAMESGVPKMILDTASLDLLKGSKVDFVMELIGSEFKITDNPLATSACGCGTSFDIKI